jgi:hypothetical protein
MAFAMSLVLGVGAIEGSSKGKVKKQVKGKTPLILPVRALGPLQSRTAPNLTHGLCFYA